MCASLASTFSQTGSITVLFPNIFRARIESNSACPQPSFDRKLCDKITMHLLVSRSPRSMLDQRLSSTFNENSSYHTVQKFFASLCASSRTKESLPRESCEIKASGFSLAGRLRACSRSQIYRNNLAFKIYQLVMLFAPL